MTTLQLKTNLHILIDKIENDKILSKFYTFLDQANKSKDGLLWQNLSETEKTELIQIDRETDLEENLIDHSVILEKYKEWL
jgi:hypothetical protein